MVSIGGLLVKDENTFEYIATAADKQGIVIGCTMIGQRFLKKETQHDPAVSYSPAPGIYTYTPPQTFIWTTFTITLQMTRKGHAPYDSHLTVVNASSPDDPLKGFGSAFPSSVITDIDVV